MARMTADQKLRAINDLIDGFPQVAWEFFVDRSHNYTLATLRGYAYDLRTFFGWLQTDLRRDSLDGLDWQTVAFPVIRQFFRFATGYDSKDRFGHGVRRQNSLKGFARKLAAISSFFEYLVAMEYARDNPVGSKARRAQILGRRAGGPRQDLPVYLNRDESSRLLRAVQTYDRRRDHGASRERDYALLATLLFTGMRVSELVGLNRQSIEYESTGHPAHPVRGMIRVFGKGEKTRMLALHPAVDRLIQEYLKARPQDDVPADEQDALFLNRWRRRMTRHGVWQIVSKYARAARLPPKEKRITPHKLRHSFATMLLQDGHVSLRELQELLGHASINTTTIYTHVADERLRRVVEEHPLGDALEPS